MSGIRTVPDLRDRCWVDEMSGCWVWRGACSDGHPRLWIPEAGEAGRTLTGPRAAWFLTTGKLPDVGAVVYRARCSNDLCVNPGHMALAASKAEHGAHLRQTGELRGDPMRSVVNTRNARKHSKVTPEMRETILASNEPGLHLAPKLGVSRQTVSKIRRHERWAGGGIPASSVFAQLRRAA